MRIRLIPAPPTDPAIRAALAYNGIGIPVAAGVLYPFLGIRLSPVIAAAMALSSLSVVINASRLRRWHPAALLPASENPGEPQVESPQAVALAPHLACQNPPTGQ